MAITPPAFQKDAVPSLKGWHHPKTNELLKSTRHTQAQIDEFNGITVVTSPIAIEITKVVEDEEIIIDTTNDIPGEIEDMSKKELEKFARENLDVELDRRLSKPKLLKQVAELVKR